MKTKPDEEDVLVKFERETLPPDFRKYYAAKRQNFFASIQRFPLVWKCFASLDQIWLREFEDMKVARDVNRMFPLILYMNCHVKARLAFELGFSGCLPEAHSLFRDAIESAAHGHRLFSDPKLLEVWLKKNEGEGGSKAFNKEFWESKEDRLFEGLDDLHRFWKKFSESGSHTSIDSVSQRFVIDETPPVLEWRLNYTGVDSTMLIPALFEMILGFHLLESVLFRDCQERLQLDAELNSMRRRFDQVKKETRQGIIVSFNLQRPNRATV